MTNPSTGTRELVRYDVRDTVAHVVLDSPPLNILTAAMMDALASAFARAQDDTALTAVAVSAAGRAFSAGADVGEHRPERAPAMIASFSRLFGVLGAIELPVVIAVQGAALGAGFELAMMADVLLAGERATFGQPEIRLGFFAPVGVAWLSSRIGLARALEVTCTGRTFTAAEMAAMGLVSRVVDADDLPAATDAVLADLRRASPVVMRMNVRLARRSVGRPFEEARHAAEEAFLRDLMSTEDVREGIASFFEKRAPSWRNR